MKTARGTVVALAIAAIVCMGAWFLLLHNSTSTATQTVATDVVDKMVTTASTAKTGVANAVIDASGIKTKLQNVLESNSAVIASKAGLSQSTVDSAISKMDIESWTVATLPADAAAEATYAVNYQGADTTVTTYTDPSYVTVNMLGQSITLSVPSSAQSSLAYLPYLS